MAVNIGPFRTVCLNRGLRKAVAKRRTVFGQCRCWSAVYTLTRGWTRSGVFYGISAAYVLLTWTAVDVIRRSQGCNTDLNSVGSANKLLLALLAISATVSRIKGTVVSVPPQADVDSALPGFPIADMLNVIDTVTFTGADFSIQHDGVCRMNPELARRVAQLASERCEASDR